MTDYIAWTDATGLVNKTLVRLYTTSGSSTSTGYKKVERITYRNGHNE